MLLRSIALAVLTYSPCPNRWNDNSNHERGSGSVPVAITLQSCPYILSYSNMLLYAESCNYIPAPKFYGYDSKEHLLIIEFITYGKNLKEHCTDIGRFPITSSRYIGRLLGVLHHLTKIGTSEYQQCQFAIYEVSPAKPGILSIFGRSCNQLQG